MWGRGQQIGGDGRGRDELLKVVQHQQQVLIAQIVFDTLQQRAAAGGAHVELLGNASDKLHRIGIVGQRDEDRAVRKVVQDLLRGL